MKKLTGFISIFFGALFDFSKKSSTVKMYLNLVRKESEVTVYSVIADGLFVNFFNALDDSKKLFSSKNEVKDFCENRLSNWLRVETTTNLFFCKMDANKPATPDNIEVIIEDVRANHFILRSKPIVNSAEEAVVWEFDLYHKTFVLA